MWRVVRGVSRNTGAGHSVLYASDLFFLSQVFPESFLSGLADVRGDTLVTGCMLSPACVPSQCWASPDLLPLGIPSPPCGALGNTLTPSTSEAGDPWSVGTVVISAVVQPTGGVGTSPGPRLAPQSSRVSLGRGGWPRLGGGPGIGVSRIQTMDQGVQSCPLLA